MTNEFAAGGTQLQRFQELLRELFQFDCADLDFGIYRIMNHKRDVVERFIGDELPKRISGDLETGRLAREAQAAAALEKARETVLENFGGAAIDPDGNLDDRYSETPRGEDYLRARAAAAPGRGRRVVEADVYNHLYAFFSRYYQDGDFISKRRYSRGERYAIPYNGEEVYLHWANSDQYYVKTGEHFHNYDWTAPNGVSARFRLEAADVEQDNVKGDRRFFAPLAGKTKWDEDERAVTIPFEYRPLTAREAVRYGARGQQEKIIEAAVDEIPRRLGDAPDALAALMGERRRNADGEPVSHLEHHLRQYTRRNDSDFFIHKDLRGFLSRELDFYLKNEVLSLDDLEAAGEDAADGWFQQMRLIKSVGGDIIDFLGQIEDFQKMLWEKRKFVVDTQYCVTLGNVAPEFHPEIAANDAQWEEWRDLLGVDGADRSVSLLASRPTLPLDTRHFDSDFTDRLLASFDDIDGMTDGLLIHSENWQALGLLQERFGNSVQCLYIDPPYNTGDSEILYKNGYLRSSWLTLMENRLSAVLPLLGNDPTAYIAIDDFQMVDLCELVDRYFPSVRRDMIIVNHHPQGGKASTLSTTHEYMLTCLDKTSSRALVGRGNGGHVERRPFKRSGTAESNFRYARPNSFYAILVDPDTSNVVGLEVPPAAGAADYPKSDTDEGYTRVYPLGAGGEERVWRRSYESCLSLLSDGKLECSGNGSIYQLVSAEDRTAALFSNWTDSRYNAGTFGANLLGDIIGRHNPFPYPKSVHTVGDAIFAARVERDEYCIDYFAGSGTTGHAVIDLNREDGGQRKFILVEMGEYFDTVLLPRIKKVTFSPEWKNGKPKRKATKEEAQRSPRIVKYARLESYEDALDGIGFDDEAGRLRLEESIDGYLLRYMLKWETRRSETLLNAARLTSPFDYRLRAHANGATRERTADVAETFAYLLGLNVRTRRAHDDDGRRYLVYRGETRDAPGRAVAVVWRTTEDWTQADFARDRRFVDGLEAVKEADVVYVNGDSVIPGAKAVEPIFKARMFAGAVS